MTDRSLDALIAERVCGWTDIQPDGWHMKGNLNGLPPGAKAAQRARVRRYSSSGDGMLAVVEAMSRRGFVLLTVSGPDKPSKATYYRSPSADEEPCGRGTNASLPRAVCLAALRALGVEVGA